MSTDFENQNNEVLTDEIKEKIDNELKKNEDAALPESLSTQNVQSHVAATPQNIVAGKKTNKHIGRRVFAGVAAAAIVITSLAVLRPWNRVSPAPVALEEVSEKTQTPSKAPEKDGGKTQKPSKAPEKVDENTQTPPQTPEKVDENTQTPLKEPNRPENYEQIESLFVNYSKNYQKQTGRSYNSADFIGFEALEAMGKYCAALPESLKVESEYGKTNEQVDGVNEADVIKNDGKYLYIVAEDRPDWDKFYDEFKSCDYLESGDENDLPVLDYDCRIDIVEQNGNSAPENVSAIHIARPVSKGLCYMRVNEMYVSGDKLIAICEIDNFGKTDPYMYISFVGGYSGYSQPGTGVTVAVCYDISNKKAPVEEWRIYQDGDYISSRFINNELVLLSSYCVDLQFEEEKIKEICIPCAGENGVDERIPVDSICIMDDIKDSTYLVASVVDINDKSTYATEAVLGGGENVYCTTETLYVTNSEVEDIELAENVYGCAYSKKTDIFKFDIRNCDIKYVADTRVDGWALNQFSIDEYNGNLRIATTIGDWDDGLSNQLYVLNENLEVIGSLENIAPGEEIRSVRFVGDTAYLVTLKNTDPLFVVDLSDAENPKISGKLEIPGFSSYLHPVADGYVLGIGVDGDESGTNGGIKISLFDCADSEEPKEVAKFVIPKGQKEYVNTSVRYNHKSICWDAKNGIMYIPFEIRDDNVDSNMRFTRGVLAIKVDTDANTLTKVGEYTHNEGAFIGSGASVITRTTYTGNTVFAFSTTTGNLYAYNKTTGDYLGMYTADTSIDV